MRFLGMLAGLVVLSGLAVKVHGADFSHSYLELVADTSSTDNTARGAVEDAGGRLFALRGALELSDSWYVKVGYSREHKSFSNEIMGTMLDLDSDQTFLELGLGYHREMGEATDLHAEVFVLDTEVDHDVPDFTPATRGLPQVSTRVSIINGAGIGSGVGVRHRIGERYEVEGRFSLARIDLDIGDDQTETTLAVGGRTHVTPNVSIGAFVSYSRNTDANFDNIRKVGGITSLPIPQRVGLSLLVVAPESRTLTGHGAKAAGARFGWNETGGSHQRFRRSGDPKGRVPGVPSQESRSRVGAASSQAMASSSSATLRVPSSPFTSGSRSSRTAAAKSSTSPV